MGDHSVKGGGKAVAAASFMSKTRVQPCSSEESADLSEQND